VTDALSRVNEKELEAIYASHVLLFDLQPPAFNI